MCVKVVCGPIKLTNRIMCNVCCCPHLHGCDIRQKRNTMKKFDIEKLISLVSCVVGINI